jgi:ParB-like chromosome segregation protein Spo0J
MDTTIRDGKQFVNISSLKINEDNPRTITSENFQRLKNHLKKFSQYKPILVTKEGVVVGGNMRLLAMKDLDIKDVWVSVVDAKTKAKMLEYILSDNENFGDWDEEKLAEMLTEEWTNLDAKDFKLEFGKETLEELLEKFGPGGEEDLEDEEEEEESEGKKMIECPKCHHVFKP